MLSAISVTLAACLSATRGSPHIPRRALLAATAPLLIGPATPSQALAAGRPRVQVLSQPSLCQARCQDQDYVVVKYVGRRTNGIVFDDRYATRPVVYELGSFYLPGVDDVLEGSCVGSRFKFTWPSSPPLGDEQLLPANTPIELELEVVSIRYSLFGEKMRDPTNSYWFAEGPLTLTSAADYQRGHSSPRLPEVNKDNPFSIAPGEKSIISNPASVITPLFTGFFGDKQQ